MVANAIMTLLYWHLARRLLAENLQDERPTQTNSCDGVARIERRVRQAFRLCSLYRTSQFGQCFANQEIVSTLSTQLSWGHFMMSKA